MSDCKFSQESPNFTDRPLLSIGVRALAESSRTHGGLGSTLFAGITGVEGIRLHQRFQQNAKYWFPDDKLYFEVPVSGVFRDSEFPFDLRIEGRCDLLMRHSNGDVKIVEIKGYRGHPTSLPEHGDPVHLAQAMLYAALLFQETTEGSAENDAVKSAENDAVKSAENDAVKSTENSTAKSTKRSAKKSTDDKKAEKGYERYPTSSVEIWLCYLSLDTGEPHFIKTSHQRQEIDDFFRRQCTAFAESSGMVFAHRRERDDKNKVASFPYPRLRDGQKDMMREIMAAIRDQQVLFVSAPTGIGKTMATLYPSIKAQANGLTDQIFYITPTRSQRKVAEDALDDLSQKGFIQRSITIQAKEQMCISPRHFCNTLRCPCAVTYYERVKEAIRESYTISRITPSTVRELGRKYTLCPYELSLDLLSTCDTVICDYNYIFNPRVRWSDRLDDTGARYTLLVDEAHNLARRSREMFSAFLSLADLLAFRKKLLDIAHTSRSKTRSSDDMPVTSKINQNGGAPVASKTSQNDDARIASKMASNITSRVILTQDTRSSSSYDQSSRPKTVLPQDVNQVLRTLDRLIADLMRFLTLFDDIQEKGDNDVLQEKEAFLEELKPYHPVLFPRFLATRATPSFILKDVSVLVGTLTRFFETHVEFPGRESVLIMYFDLLFFQRVVDRYYDHTYITCFRQTSKDNIAVSLMTLDASGHLTDLYYGRSPVVFFSATLSPMPYYQSLLDAHVSQDHPETIQLPSPFPSERRLVIAYEAHSIRYKDRLRTLPNVARLIAETIRLRKGHYLIFSPSFAYQRQLARALNALNVSDIDWVIQPPRMTDSQKNCYLAYFRDNTRNHPLAGLTVLGSLFNEGIDLAGEELTGVIIVGTGLPGLSPERDLLKQFYDATTGQGYEFAYLWPGLNRVAQAAGRLIRSENDYGIVLLIDDRYADPVHRALLPDEWHTEHMSDANACLARIRQFWHEIEASEENHLVTESQ